MHCTIAETLDFCGNMLAYSVKLWQNKLEWLQPANFLAKYSVLHEAHLVHYAIAETLNLTTFWFLCKRASLFCTIVRL